MEKLIKGVNATTEEIARKVNEIVAWINNEENTDRMVELYPMKDDASDWPNGGEPCKKHGLLFCEKCYTEKSSTTKYPDFEKWREDAIESNVWLGFDEDGRDEFLTIAPEDFYIEKDGKKQYYFTWDEAMKLEEEVLKPNGWRLPTCKEWAQICEYYIKDDGSDDVERFMKELKMEMKGYLDEDAMKNGGKVSYVGSEGLFWSSTSASAPGARRLLFLSSDLYPQNSSYKGFGLSVRCVACEKIGSKE